MLKSFRIKCPVLLFYYGILFCQKDELSSTFQVPYSQLPCARWACPRHGLLLVLLINSILEKEWEKNGYTYWILWTLFSYLRWKNVRELIIICAFIYSCRNTTILGKKPTTQQSSVRSKNKRAFLLLRRRRCTSKHVWRLCAWCGWVSSGLGFPSTSRGDYRRFLLSARRQDLSHERTGISLYLMPSIH